MSKTNYTDQQLIELLQDKSEEAFNALYDNYSPALYGIVLRIVNSEDIAQDVLQDSFIKMWKNFEKYDASKGTLFTWILNIARNTAIDANRSKHVKYHIRNGDQIVSLENGKSISNNFDH